MSLVPGFGVNYKSAQANWATDMAYFKSIKNPKTPFGIRPNLTNGTLTDAPSDNGGNANLSYWFECAQFFAADPDFFVTCGISGEPGCLSSSLWSSYASGVIANAQYMQENNIVLGDYEIGNELENAISPQIYSLTQTSGTATCVLSVAHNFQNGEEVTIWNVTPGSWNGTYGITVVNSTTFTFSVSSSLANPINPYPGWCYSLSMTQLITNIQELATSCHGVNSTTPISYGMGGASVNGINPYTQWISAGLGGLDTVSIHPYGNINLGTLLAMM